MHTWQLVLILLILGLLYYLVNYTEYSDIKRSSSSTACDRKEGMNIDMLKTLPVNQYNTQTLQQGSPVQLSINPMLPYNSATKQNVINQMYTNNNVLSDGSSIDSNVSSTSNVSSISNMSSDVVPKVVSTIVPNIMPITAPSVTSNEQNDDNFSESSENNGNDMNNQLLDQKQQTQSNPLGIVDNSLVLKNPPRNTLSEDAKNKIALIKNKLNIINESTNSQNDSECEPEEVKTCTAKTCGFNNLHPILDPRFNMREAAKQCILLEDHLNTSKKRCMDCINKHFLTVDGFLEEAVSLEQNISKRDFYRKLYFQWVDIQKRYVLQKHNPDNMDLISKEIRMFRKTLVEQYFDTVSEYSE